MTLYFIGDETGMQQVRQRFEQEPSLVVQYISVCALIDHYGPKAFGRDEEAVTLARNVLARKHTAERRHLQMVPRVIVEPLEVVQEVVHSDSLQ